MATAIERRNNTVAEIADAFRGARTVTAICHENPDADTVGAAIAVSILAERIGAETEIVSVDRPAPVFDFLPRIDRVRSRPSLEPGLAVTCDAATLERVGRITVEHADWFAGATLVNIDHHVSNDGFGNLNLVDPAAAATCEILLRLAYELGLDLDRDLATPLLAGIVRDSHGFSDPATSAETLRAAARLVEAGAELAPIHRRILGEMPYPMLALWGRILSTIGEAHGGRVVYAVLTREMLETTGTEQHDADGVVEFMARAKGADAALLLRELGAAETRVSIRTTPAVDATAIAAVFGGGGHARRAGCTIAAHVDEAVGLALSAIPTR